MLTWMVGLAVGTLAGSGLLHLMPHTYDMTYETYGSWGFLFKASAIFAGSYLFLCLERLLKTLSENRTKKRRLKESKKMPIVSVINEGVGNNNNNGGVNGAVNGGVDFKKAPAEPITPVPAKNSDAHGLSQAS